MEATPQAATDPMQPTTTASGSVVGSTAPVLEHAHGTPEPAAGQNSGRGELLAIRCDAAGSPASASEWHGSIEAHVDRNPILKRGELWANKDYDVVCSSALAPMLPSSIS